MDIIKIVAPEVQGNTTPQAFSNVRLVKVVTDGSNVVVTRAFSNGTAIGNTTLLTSNLYWLAKSPTDTLAFTSNVLVTPCAFQS
jgi:hypothetical protein